MIGSAFLLALTVLLGDPGQDWLDSLGSDDTVPVPVITPILPGKVESLRVCLNEGGLPNEFPVLYQACYRGAGRCTAFVAVPVETARIVLMGYDVSNPPMVVDSPDRCTGPSRQTSVNMPALPEGD